MSKRTYAWLAFAALIVFVALTLGGVLVSIFASPDVGVAMVGIGMVPGLLSAAALGAFENDLKGKS